MKLSWKIFFFCSGSVFGIQTCCWTECRQLQQSHSELSSRLLLGSQQPSWTPAWW